MMQGIEKIKIILLNEKVLNFVRKNLKISLAEIGYSPSLIEDLINQLKELDFEGFQKRHEEELYRIHSIGFFQKIVPFYFGKEVIPYIPKSKSILDIGCGTGILAHELSKTNKFNEIMGIDINTYPEWEKFREKKVNFFVINEEKFDEFLTGTKPETIVLTWTLHHMDFNEQERYLRKIYSRLDKVILVALEDSFSEKMLPTEDIGVYESFNKLNFREKMQFISILDWLANRVLERRERIPIPFAYRTLEDWQELFEKIGFKIVEKRYIGFPKNRDVNTPQSLIIVKK